MGVNQIGNILTKTINVARDFNKFPFGRFREDGPNSAQAFLEDLLIPALKTSEVVTVDLTYARALGSSFLDGVFGMLVRRNGWSVEEFERRVIIKSDIVPTHLLAIKDYVSEAALSSNA